MTRENERGKKSTETRKQDETGRKMGENQQDKNYRPKENEDFGKQSQSNQNNERQQGQQNEYEPFGSTQNEAKDRNNRTKE